MNRIFLAAAAALVLGGTLACNQAPTTSTTPKNSADMSVETSEGAAKAGSVYDFTVKGLDGKDVKLSQYKGKKILIVNTASECGYTPQYKGLEELSKARSGKLVVLGFPCNQFGGQEPGSAKEIASFCEKNYGVTFPLMEKVEVKGAGAAPLFQHLQKATGSEPSWNFCKYLIDADGKVVKFYSSRVEPMSSELLADIDKA
jgi:glutathione peroxidase